MNTPAHLLIGAAVFGRGGDKKIFLAAMAGALLPDASLYVMGSVAIFVLHIPPNVVFDELYFSPAWQTVFAIDNSFVVWGALCVAALLARVPWAMALTRAALLHLLLDMPLHHDDGRPHFWPFTNWVFESPVSYWDRTNGANWVAPVEAVLSVVAATLLWRARLGPWITVGVAVLLAAEIWVVRQWLFFFTDS